MLHVSACTVDREALKDKLHCMETMLARQAARNKHVTRQDEEEIGVTRMSRDIHALQDEGPISVNYDSGNGVSRLDGSSGKGSKTMGEQAPPALATRVELTKAPFRGS